MKTKIYTILKVLGYICGLSGGILLIGFIGTYEIGQSTFKQFCIQELFAIVLIIAAVAIYQIRFELMWHDEHKNKKQTRRSVHNK